MGNNELSSMRASCLAPFGASNTPPPVSNRFDRLPVELITMIASHLNPVEKFSLKLMSAWVWNSVFFSTDNLVTYDVRAVFPLLIANDRISMSEKSKLISKMDEAEREIRELERRAECKLGSMRFFDHRNPGLVLPHSCRIEGGVSSSRHSEAWSHRIKSLYDKTEDEDGFADDEMDIDQLTDGGIDLDDLEDEETGNYDPHGS